MMKYMIKVGEVMGNVDGMMGKIVDFYDIEVEVIMVVLILLIEFLLIVFFGVVVGGIVMVMFFLIFNFVGVVGGF